MPRLAGNWTLSWPCELQNHPSNLPKQTSSAELKGLTAPLVSNHLLATQIQGFSKQRVFDTLWTNVPQRWLFLFCCGTTGRDNERHRLQNFSSQLILHWQRQHLCATEHHTEAHHLLAVGKVREQRPTSVRWFSAKVERPYHVKPSCNNVIPIMCAGHVRGTPHSVLTSLGWTPPLHQTIPPPGWVGLRHNDNDDMYMTPWGRPDLQPA